MDLKNYTKVICSYGNRLYGKDHTKIEYQIKQNFSISKCIKAFEIFFKKHKKELPLNRSIDIH